METSLVKIQSLTPDELFKNKALIPAVESIIKEVRSIPTDPTTPKKEQREYRGWSSIIQIIKSG